VISPLLANIYLHALDQVWEHRGYWRKPGPDTRLVRYADDLVLLTGRDAQWAMDRLREILERLDLELNEEKSRIVDAEKEPFDFLGFTFRRVWDAKRGKRAVLHYPSKKSQKRLRKRIKAVLNPMAPVSTEVQIQRTNVILRGWTNYFRVSNANAVFQNMRWYVECRVRRVLQRQAGHYGLGWKRYHPKYLYDQLGLFNDYHVRWLPWRP